MLFLRHLVDGDPVSIYELRDLGELGGGAPGARITIGRASHNTINVNDATASGEHAVIECTADGYCLKDLGSTNGVFVAGEKVETALLQNGDVVTIGTHVFEVADSPSVDLDKTAKIKKSWIPGVFYTEK
jgi:pSer/pThr/pTyr-binding forkhead associated (FHA) protein